jgi:glycerophosphoryl diester phosphodiesterase
MTPSQILAHRGLWSRPEQKNSRDALVLALSRGFGLETDIRDHDGELVISHDPPRAGGLRLGDLLDDYRRLDARGTLALNIKSDGLAEELGRMLRSCGIERYFVFDMSVPDMLHYQRRKMRFFSRRSDLEPHVAALDACAGIWLDAFQSDWYKSDAILELLAASKHVAVVSPELHGRDRQGVWQMLRQIPDPAEQLLCCTDFPEDFLKWMS